MLTELQIKNVAIIDNLTIEFGNGFNVLTGETGAGKSILIDSINMALGGRTSKDLVRTGTDYAFVQAVFEPNSAVIKKLEELDIEAEDGQIILSRRLTADGRSTCRVNGRTSPLSVVREISEALLTIHGQLDNQALLVPSMHRGFVDDFAGNGELITAYNKKFSEYSALRAELQSLIEAQDGKEQRLELLKFQYEEINSAQLRPEEEDELIKRQEFLSNIEKIMIDVNQAYDLLYGDESPVYDMLYDAEKALESASQHDDKLSGYSETVTSALADIEDVASELKAYIDSVDFEANELDSVQERLAYIAGLKRKYNCTAVSDIIAYGQKCKAEIETIDNLDSEIKTVEAKVSEAETAMKTAADDLTESRTEAGKKLSEAIMNELKELDMKRVVFSVNIEKTEYSLNGCDNIEFLISTNPGEALKPLNKIASGGEMSRIMLAIKSILSKGDIVDTLIFDEIDTGVSGRAAQKISEKICKLSRTKQVLCITHLAQIASMGDNHYLIEKSADVSETKTHVRMLTRDERCGELARIIGGVSVTDTTTKAAEEMLNQADRLKKTLK